MADLPRKLAKALLPRRVRSRLRRTLRPEGDLRGVMDLRGETDDPVAALYLAHRSSPVVEVPLAACIGFQPVGMPLDPAQHPFSVTVAQLEQSPDLAYQASALYAYHQAFAPETAAQVLGLEDVAPDAPLARLAAPAVVLPWWTDRGGMNIAERTAGWHAALQEDYLRAGFKPPAVIPAPNWFGPGTAETGEIELQRLQRLLHAIRSGGFKRHDGPDGDVTGVVLQAAGEPPRIMLHGGQHRAAVAASLGMERIPVRLFPAVSRALIRRDEVRSWPHVHSGLFTPEQALLVFDRMLAGVPSSAAFPAEG